MKSYTPNLSQQRLEILKSIPADYLKQTPKGMALLLALQNEEKPVSEQLQARHIAENINEQFGLVGEHRMIAMNVGNIVKRQAPQLVTQLAEGYMQAEEAARTEPKPMQALKTAREQTEAIASLISPRIASLSLQVLEASAFIAGDQKTEAKLRAVNTELHGEGYQNLAIKAMQEPERRAAQVKAATKNAVEAGQRREAAVKGWFGSMAGYARQAASEIQRTATAISQRAQQDIALVQAVTYAQETTNGGGAADRLDVIARLQSAAGRA